MGVVWAARMRGPKQFRKLVAVKAMLPVVSSDPRFEAMFVYEARVAAGIRHPNVCEILDFGEHSGTLFMVMEWVDGEPLTALSGALGALPVGVATRIGIDVARGLHAAHLLETGDGAELGLVHCDVSPPNILVTGEGVVKIIDFGLAKAAAEAAPVGDLVGGKLSFMSPEQAAGADVDARTDVFALGLVLYEMITNQHPFEAPTPLAVLQRIRDETSPVLPPRALLPECPPAVSDAIVRALRRDPAERFPDMRAFGQALERGLAELALAERAGDVGELVRATLGERIDRRRAAIREAMRSAEARFSAPPPRSSSLPPPLPPSALGDFLGAACDASLSAPLEDSASGAGMPPRTTAPVALSSLRARADGRVLGSLAVVTAFGIAWGLARRSDPPPPTSEARTGVAAAAKGSARPDPAAAARRSDPPSDAKLDARPTRPASVLPPAKHERSFSRERGAPAATSAESPEHPAPEEAGAKTDVDPAAASGSAARVLDPGF
jgi:serine/threonine-protein kinase